MIKYAVNLVMNLINNKQLLRYLVMAVVIVCIELVSFQIILTLIGSYQLATVLSFLIGVILNWIFSRILVFKTSKHHPIKEFFLVLIASLGGVAIQLFIVTVLVSLFNLYPILGKMASICFSFFWNYWIRSKFIFKS